MKLDFEKYSDGLVPAIVQDAKTNRVLMLGFMNAEALETTESTKKATFFSRSRGKLWTKGETNGNFLDVEEILVDCDADTILIKATPAGATCHTGADTCFSVENLPAEARGGKENEDFLFELEEIIKDRKVNASAQSYTTKLLAKGINKVAQKVGEEAVELIIEAKDENDELFKDEAADLLYHFLVLLAAKDIELNDVLTVLKQRKR